ncbi:MAG: hypothetical protein IT428_07035 [Planctomycetaceae bacterium]|nr:hypothetical protein [Planctomycetaceae bacterium]
MKSHTRTSIFVASVALAAVFSAGCGGSEKDTRETGEIGGTISLNGVPLKEGSVCLTGERGTDVALGTIEPDGSFKMKYHQRNALPVGIYKITVSGGGPTEQPSPQELMANPQKYNVKNPIPEKYRTVKTTDLTAKVEPGQNPPLDIELKGTSK